MDTFNELFLAAYNFFSDDHFDLAIEKLNEAEKVYSSVGENEFSLEDFYILRGTTKFSKQQFEEAKNDFEKALNTNPSSSEACLGLGKYFLVNGLDENAKKMFEWAVKNNPSHPGARNALADINTKLGVAEDDNSVLVTELIQPGETKTRYIEEASDLFVQKRFAEAIEKLTIAKKEHESFLASIENFIAFNYLGMQKIDKAEESAERALTLNPYSSQAYATLGEIDFLNNKIEAAKTKFNLALIYNRDNDFAQQGIQKVLKSSGQVQKTNSDFEYLAGQLVPR